MSTLKNNIHNEIQRDENEHGHHLYVVLEVVHKM